MLLSLGISLPCFAFLAEAQSVLNDIQYCSLEIIIIVVTIIIIIERYF
jgi:hypothetical protein